MEIAKTDFLNTLAQDFAIHFVSKAIVRESIEKRYETDKSGKIIYLTKRCSWKSSVYEVEKELGIEGEIIYGIFKDSNSNGYRVQCVPVENQGFENRLGLKKEWRGVKVDELKKISKIDDIVFCHHAGFIGGAVSYESALKMAQLSLKK